MTSFLSFVYKRRSSAPSTFHPSQADEGSSERRRTSNQEPPRAFLNGLSSSSSSEDAAAWEPRLSQDDDDLFDTPFTPEGLLPRKSADSIRRELNVPPRSLEETLRRSQGHEPLSGVAKILSDQRSHHHEHHNKHSKANRSTFPDCHHFHTGILPPPVDYLERKPTFESSIQSPPVSTSSFYSRQSHDRVAMSPVLRVGQARTAVGALVALREASDPQQNRTSRAAAPVYTSNREKMQSQKQNSFAMKVLPPQTNHMKNLEDIQYEKEYDDLSETMSETENAYVPLEETNHPSTPSNRRLKEDEDSLLYASPSSMQPPSYYQSRRVNDGNREVDISYSSRTELIRPRSKDSLEETKGSDAYDFYPIVLPPSSSSSSSSSSSTEEGIEDEIEEDNIMAQMIQTENSNQFYDFNEDALDDALMSRKFQNQQRQKQFIAARKVAETMEDDSEECYSQEEEEGESELESCEEANGACIAEIDDPQDNVSVQDATTCPSFYVNGGGMDFEDALLRRKARSQRQEKQTIMMEVVARLRDNLDLVADIEVASSHSMATEGAWFAKTPLDAENLLTGFSSQSRNKLLNSVDSILKEMNVAQPEEFFLSPSQMPVHATQHDTLCQALLFCRSLIYTAVPQAEREKLAMNLPSGGTNPDQKLYVWKCVPEFRAALGLVPPPETPDTIRGGGTSLFSLPEESGADTPHTSNVSMATSISSAVNHHPRSTSRPQLILHQDGLQLRHNTAIITSLIQKLSVSCLQLLGLTGDKEDREATQTYVRACEEIKQLYLQLLAINKTGSMALMEAFYLDVLSRDIAVPLLREVSEDEDDHALVPRREYLLDGTTSVVSRSIPEHLPRQTSCDEADDQDGANLFSPSTEDMRSWAGGDNKQSRVPYEFDDLRRQLGSFERETDGQDEQRESLPPCQDILEPEEGSAEWKRRMYHNVSLAASSIRSEERSLKVDQ